VTLTLLEDDHQLIRSLPEIWDAMAPFLELRNAAAGEAGRT
jgi:hypothetical protein